MPTFKIFDIDSIPTTKDLLNEYLVNVITTAPGITDISIGSKLWCMGYAASRALSSAYYTLHFYRKQSFVITASGKYLDLHAIEVGLTRHKANYARGKATFSRTTSAPYDLLIPSGTIITTPVTSSDVPVVRFTTTDDTFILRGNTSGEVDIICLSPGTDGNLTAGAISRIESQITGAQFVTTTSTSGGTLQETDSNLRMRILTAWVARESGTANAIRNAVLAVQGIKSVIVIDPARHRTEQEIILKSIEDEETSSLPQVKIKTVSPTTAKHDLYFSVTPSGCQLEQVDAFGNVLLIENIPTISNGFELIDNINYWSKSALLRISSIAIDDNPYDDANPVATDNYIAKLKSISPDTSVNDITFIIQDQIGSNTKQVIISTTAQYKRNEILGQTELSPLIETYSNISTYAALASRINSNSKILHMYLLDKKIATQPLTPTYDLVRGTNIVVATFKPVTQIVSPIDTDVVLLDGANGIIGVGGATLPITISYEYIARMRAGDTIIGFADAKPENIAIVLKSDGSEVVYAEAIGIPDADGQTYNYGHCSKPISPLARTKFDSKYEMMRGVVEVVPIPFAIGDDEATNDVYSDVVTAIEQVKPAGVEVMLNKPSVQYIDVSIAVAVEAKSGYSPNAYYSIIIQAITEYINALDMGETAYRDRIIAAANPEVEGLAVAHIASPAVDITPPSMVFLRAGNITCTAAATD